jgi:hypothetical protein
MGLDKENFDEDNEKVSSKTPIRKDHVTKIVGDLLIDFS